MAWIEKCKVCGSSLSLNPSTRTYTCGVCEKRKLEASGALEASARSVRCPACRTYCHVVDETQKTHCLTCGCQVHPHTVRSASPEPEENVVELHRHSPTAASVVSRLQRHVDEIENILVWIDWKSGGGQLAHNTMPDELLAYGASAVQHCVQHALFGDDDG